MILAKMNPVTRRILLSYASPESEGNTLPNQGPVSEIPDDPDVDAGKQRKQFYTNDVLGNIETAKAGNTQKLKPYYESLNQLILLSLYNLDCMI